MADTLQSFMVLLHHKIKLRPKRIFHNSQHHKKSVRLHILHRNITLCRCPLRTLYLRQVVVHDCNGRHTGIFHGTDILIYNDSKPQLGVFSIFFRDVVLLRQDPTRHIKRFSNTMQAGHTNTTLLTHWKITTFKWHDVLNAANQNRRCIVGLIIIFTLVSRNSWYILVS